MSSCLSGGGRTYGFELDIVKPPSPSIRSSPSSTLSESSNCPIAISTRKPRTPRKRPNQTYAEAAALLSTIYPNIFSTKNLRKPCKHLKSYDSFSESSELLPPFPSLDNAGFLLHQRIPEKPISRIEPKPAISGEKACESPVDVDYQLNSPSYCDGYEEDFDAESILDEEMEDAIGIDSIMGNQIVNMDTYEDSSDFYSVPQISSFYGSNPMGFWFGGKLGFGFGGCVNALRHVDDGDWWRNPTVEILDILPKFKPPAADKKKKKKKNKKKVEEDVVKEEFRASQADLNSGLSLKLNYEEVLSAWSGSPFSDEIPMTDAMESSPDAIARLQQFDLISGIGNWRPQDEYGGVREASVLRYKEKRRTRLFSKKIRYQVRKVNADRRPRMKGRFVRSPSLLH